MTVLPCPFCGSKDIATEGPSYTQFMCNDCGSATYDQNSHAEAIAAWNRRASRSSGEPVAELALINDLRREEGDQVTILCDNPDFNGQPNNAVIVNAGWTNWQDFRVSGHTLAGALENAVAIKAMAPADRPLPPHPVPSLPTVDDGMVERAIAVVLSHDRFRVNRVAMHAALTATLQALHPTAGDR